MFLGRGIISWLFILSGAVFLIFLAFKDYPPHPGSISMYIQLWLKHPLSKKKRSDAEVQMGWDWHKKNDPDE